MPRPGLSLLLQHIRRLAARPTAGLSDAQLIARFAATRDEDAFAALLERHGAMVLGVCRRVLRDEHAGEDAFQATFFVLARKAASIRKGASVASWLHGVALRVAHKARIAAIRRQRRERQQATPLAAEAANTLTWEELRSILDEELGRLAARWRDPLILCYLEGRTQDEAADRLGWSKSTLRRRLERGRQILQARLTRRGVTLSASLCAPLLTDAGARTKAVLAATRKAALAFGDGTANAAATSSSVAALADSVLQGMALTSGKLAAKTVCILLLLACAGLGAYHAVARLAPFTSTGEPADVQAVEPQRPPVDQWGDPLPPEALARLGTIRLRTGTKTCAIAFAPHGRSLASSGYHAVVHIWESRTGKELQRFASSVPHGFESVRDLAYSPDGATLAAARINQSPCLWDVATGKELYRLGKEDDRAHWIVYSPDGQAVVYGDEGGFTIARLADAMEPAMQRFRQQGLVSRAAFSSDGKTIACADEEGIHLIEVVTGRRRGRLQAEQLSLPISALAFSPRGMMLALASTANKSIRLVDVASGKTLWSTAPVPALSGAPDRAPSIHFTPDGKSLISGHEDGHVRIWDAASGALVRQFRGHPYKLLALTLSADGQTLATSCESPIGGDFTIRLWETATGKPLARYTAPEQAVQHVCFSPDSKQVATASGEGTVQLWEAVSGRLLKTWQRPGLPVAFTADGRHLICCGFRKIHLLDVATGKEARQFPTHQVRAMALSCDGKFLATTGTDHLLQLRDVATGRLVQDFGGKQDAWAYGVAFSRDGKLLATVQHHSVRLWDTATGKLVREHVEQGTDYVGSAAFSPDGKLLASTCSGVRNNQRFGLIRLRDVATGKEIRQLPGEGDPCDAIAFSPDGRTLIWGGQHPKELYVWEVATGQLRHKLTGHLAHLSSIAFAPNGRMAASGSADATVLIWDITGEGRRRE